MKRFSKSHFVGGAVVLLLVVGYFCHSLPKTVAPARVKSIIKSEEPSQEMIAKLEPYVKVGDNISAVRSQLHLEQNQVPKVGNRSEWSLGLGGANLVLAIETTGEVIGIGRHLYDLDDGTVWLSEPAW